MKRLAFLIALMIALSWTATGNAQFLGNKRGFVKNEDGRKCWYNQRFIRNNRYFHDKLYGTNGIMVFDKPNCMKDTNINKMMINNVISHWYSKSDARFMTRMDELYKGSMLQKKGMCIQSQKYPIQGITVDYLTGGGNVLRVIHGTSIQGCTN